jgi:hypothetical protein
MRQVANRDNMAASAGRQQLPISKEAADVWKNFRKTIAYPFLPRPL